MLWLYLLGAVTFLIIALRRVLRKQKPLNDALYRTKVAIEHVHSGVAFVQPDGKVGSVNPALMDLIGGQPSDHLNVDWHQLFPPSEQTKVREAYTQMLLQGIASFDGHIQRGNQSRAPVQVRLVTVNDHKMRLMGHHCMIHSVERERELESKIEQLTRELGEARPMIA
jgi:PAS domain S-box-containing protein